MTNYASPPAAPLDAAGNVVIDLPCRKCAYNLRTLSINGRCPECGTAVGFSAQGDLLRFSDPGWVMTLHRGVVLILAGIAVMILGGILAAVVGAMSAGLGQVLSAVVQLGSAVLMVVGSWWLTEPDPSGLGEDRYGTSRQVIRMTLLIGVASQVLTLLATVVPLPSSVAIGLLIFAGLAGIASVVGYFAQLQYVGKLAQRIPDQQIVDRANFLKWALAGTYGFMILLGVIAALVARFSGPGAGGGVIGLACVAGLVMIALLVFAIMYLLMLDRLRRALKDQAQYATQTWAAGAAQSAARA